MLHSTVRCSLLWRRGLLVAGILLLTACQMSRACAAETAGSGDAGAEENAVETLPITLRGNPSTGYLWSWTATGDGAVRETEVLYEQDNDMPGSPATFTYLFAGEKEGDVALRFVYSRSESGNNPGDRVNMYTLKVLPDKRVALVEANEEIVGKPKPAW